MDHKDKLTTMKSALEAVLLFHSASPWTEAKRNEWWNLTQTNEATTRNLCDTVRLALGRLPSCFGIYENKLPTDLPLPRKEPLNLTGEQRVALARLGICI